MLRPHRPAALAAATLLLVAPTDGRAQCRVTEVQEIFASNGATGDQFGSALDVQGDVAVVGAPLATVQGVNSTGAAYVFRRVAGTWVEDQILTPGDPSPKWFGQAVALDGDLIVIGAPYDSAIRSNEGAAYVFRHNGVSFQQEAKLTPSDGSAQDNFGASVEVQGTTIVVGSPKEDALFASSTGAAYVFTEQSGPTWVESQKLQGFDTDGDYFGHCVSLDGDHLAVGAPHLDTFVPGAGEVYPFRLQGGVWTREQPLQEVGGQGADSFGYSVALRGSSLVIGVPGDDYTGLSAAGSSWLYEHDGTGWVPVANPPATGASTFDYFGWAAALDSSLAVVGTPWDDRTGADAGSFELRRVNGTSWPLIAVAIADDATPSDHLARSLAVDGRTVLAGAPTEDSYPTGPGSVYAYAIPDLALHVTPDVLPVGTPVSLSVCGGLTGGFQLLALVDWNGAPLFLKVSRGTFDLEGLVQRAGVTPPGLSGNTAQFQAWGVHLDGKLGASNRATVTFP